MKKPFIFRITFTVVILLSVSFQAYAKNNDHSGEIRLIVRGDDFGMSQGSLIAVEKAFNQGLLTSAGIMVPGPWFEGAAELCRKNPGWCTGIHLCLVSEWRGYRWRPVLSYDKVSSIVDADGFLFQSSEELKAHNPKLNEIEAEFRAQIDLAKKKGVNVQYIDTHYIGYNEYPGLEDVFLKLSKDYNVPISTYNGDKFMKTNFYSDPPEVKEVNLLKDIENLTPGLWILLSHPGAETPEQLSLIQSSPAHIFPGDGAGKSRAAELKVLTGIGLKSVILKKGIILTNYKEVWEEIEKVNKF